MATRKSRPQARSCLVFRLDELPMGPSLVALAGLPARYGSALVLAGESAALDAMSFLDREADPSPAEEVERLMDVAGEAVVQLTDGTSELGELEHTVHGRLSLEHARALLAEDGLTPIGLAEWWARHSDAEAPEDTLAALDAALAPLEEETPRALLDGIRAHCRSGGGVPPTVSREDHGSVWAALDDLLVPEVERWNVVHRRVLACVATGGPPQRVFLFTDAPERGRDRWGRLREALGPLGIDLDRHVDAQLALGIGAAPPPTERARAELAWVTDDARWGALVHGLPASRNALREVVGMLATSVWPASRASLGARLRAEATGGTIAAEAADLLEPVASELEDVLASQTERLLATQPARAFAIARLLEHSQPELALRAARAAAGDPTSPDRSFLPLLGGAAPDEAWRVAIADVRRGVGSDTLAALAQALEGVRPSRSLADELASELARDATAHDAFAAHGTKLPPLRPAPLASLDVTVTLDTDVALLFCLDPTAKKAAEVTSRCDEPRVIAAALSGRAAVWATGADGSFEVTLRGAPLTPDERALVAGSATFTLEVVGERLALSGGGEARRVAVPNGRYQATVHVLGPTGRYVVILAPATTGPATKHRTAPHLAA